MKDNDHLSPVKGAIFVGSQANGAEFDITLELPSGDYKFVRLKVLSYGDQKIEIADAPRNLIDELYCQNFMVGTTFKLRKLLSGGIGTVTVIWKHD